RRREAGVMSYNEPSLDERNLLPPCPLVPPELARRERRRLLQRLRSRMPARREIRAAKHDVGEMKGHLLAYGVRDLRPEGRRARQAAAAHLGLGAEREHAAVVRAVVVSERRRGLPDRVVADRSRDRGDERIETLERGTLQRGAIGAGASDVRLDLR